MKVLVATDGKDLDAKVSKRFGHAERFLLVDADTWEFEIIEGVGEEAEAHGSARMAALRINRVATGNIGPHAFAQLTGRGIDVHICRRVTARKAVERIARGECQPASEPTMKRSVHDHATGHGSGHEHHGHAHHAGEGHGADN